MTANLVLALASVLALLGCRQANDAELAKSMNTPSAASRAACDSRALQDAMTVMSSSVAGFEQAVQQPLIARDGMAQLSLAALDTAYRHRACLMSRYEFGYDIFFAQHFQRWLSLARAQSWPLAEQAKALEMIQRFEALPSAASRVSPSKSQQINVVNASGHHGGASAFNCTPILFEDSMQLVRIGLQVLEKMPESARQSRNEASFSIRLAARRASEHAACASKTLSDMQWLGHLHTVAALITYNKTQIGGGKTDAYIGAVAAELQAACEKSATGKLSNKPMRKQAEAEHDQNF